MGLLPQIYLTFLGKVSKDILLLAWSLEPGLQGERTPQHGHPGQRRARAGVQVEQFLQEMRRVAEDYAELPSPEQQGQLFSWVFRRRPRGVFALLRFKRLSPSSQRRTHSFPHFHAVTLCLCSSVILRCCKLASDIIWMKFIALTGKITICMRLFPPQLTTPPIKACQEEVLPLRQLKESREEDETLLSRPVPAAARGRDPAAAE